MKAILLSANGLQGTRCRRDHIGHGSELNPPGGVNQRLPANRVRAATELTLDGTAKRCRLPDWQ